MKTTLITLALSTSMASLMAQDKSPKKVIVKKNDSINLITKESQNKKLPKGKNISAKFKTKFKEQGLSLSKGGSGIGGGNLYNNLLDWCDDGFDILDESRIEAQDTLGIYGHKLQAIRIYYNGLISTLESRDISEANTYSSIMYRSIVRGLNLAQDFGVLDIISGTERRDAQIMDALYFLDDYYQFVLKSAYHFDRSYYIGYYAQRTCDNCSDIPTYSVTDLERDFIDYSTSQLNFWLKKFIKYSSNNEGSYSTVDPRKAMSGLAYLARETALDLDETILNNVFSCQSRQLTRLAGRIERYLGQSPNGDLDAAKLTIFKEQAKKIAHNINQKTCNF